MKIFNQQLLDLDYQKFGRVHNIRALFGIILAIISALFGYGVHNMLKNTKLLGVIEAVGTLDVIFFGILTLGFLGYTIESIDNEAKQKNLETENIILQATKSIDEGLGKKLFYQLSKLYQLYTKQVNNNKWIDNEIKPLLIELDNQLYDVLMSLKNPKTLENNQHLKSMDKSNVENDEKLQLLDMNNSPIYLKLYKKILLKEEVEQMERCFYKFKKDFPYYENKKTKEDFTQFLADLYKMIKAFQNDEIDSLSEYERRESKIWSILNSIKPKAQSD